MSKDKDPAAMLNDGARAEYPAYLVSYANQIGGVSPVHGPSARPPTLAAQALGMYDAVEPVHPPRSLADFCESMNSMLGGCGD